VLRTNLDGMFYLARAVARPMLMKRDGRIINISSVSAQRPNRGQANYAASKGGMEAFTRAMAVEMGSKKITVNAVAPGVIETEMSARVREAAGKEIKRSIPMRRFGTVDDVAGVVSFLAGPDATYVTGQTIGVDGGVGL
jgi:3-oxoacyl-[acyl-carrier protein] reductase